MNDMIWLPGDIVMAARELGAGPPGAAELVWAHGWGQSGEAFRPLAEKFERLAASTLLDFPGFGRSPPPPQSWGTADYADAVALWLKGRPAARRVWIGHSFGCRVGLQLAARHPEAISAMVLIAAAGLPRRRTLAQNLSLEARVYGYKLAKLLTPEGPARDRLRARFGSSDYKNAGGLRPIFVRVAAENLSDEARRVRCPTLLLYGKEDKDTPPEIGERLQNLIPGAELRVLEGFGHNDILGRGQHQIANEIRKFLERST